MPWRFILADGSAHEEPDDVPYEVALQRARLINNPDRVNNAAHDGIFAGAGLGTNAMMQNAQDVGDYLSAGWGNLEHTAGGIANWFGGIVNPGGIEAIRSRGEQTGGDQLQERGRRDSENALASLSPEGAAATTPHEGESFWASLSPARAERGLAESAVPLAPAIAASILSGGGVEMAGGSALAANVASRLGMAGAFGLGGAGDVDAAIDEKVRNFAAQSPDEFIHSRLGTEALRRTDGDYARAVEVAAHLAKGIIPTVAGGIEGVIGYYGINPFKRGINRAVEQSFVRDLLNESVGGAATMAGFAGVSTGASNVGAAQVNPNQDLLEGVPEAMASGAEAGALLGAGAAGLGAFRPRPIRPTIEGGQTRYNTRRTDTTTARDAEFYDTRMLPPPDSGLPSPEGAPEPPPRPSSPSGGNAAENIAPLSDAEARATEYARSAEEDPAAPIEAGDDATHAETIRGIGSNLGRAVTEIPEVPAGATRTAEPIPLYGIGTRFGNGHLGEADDTLSHQIYSHAVRNGLSPADTETFKAYSELFEGRYPDPASPGAKPDGFGIRIVDRLPNGETAAHIVSTPARSLKQAGDFAASHNGNQVVPEGAAPAPDSAVPERSAPPPAPTETIAEPAAPAFVPDVAPIRPRPKRPTTPRQFVDGLLTGQLRGASISDGQFEVLMGTEGHAAETGTDTARYAQLAKSGDVEITSSPPTKNSPQGTLNIRVTPDAKPENVKKAIAVYQRAVKDGITPSVGLHTADKPHGVLINDHSEALKTLRGIAQRNPSVAAAREAPVDTTQTNNEVIQSPAVPVDNGVIPLAVPGKVIPNVPSNIGNIYRDAGHEGLSRSLGKANVMQIRSAAKRFGIKLQPKSTRESLINQLADHFERNARFNPKTGVRLRPGRGLPEKALSPEAPATRFKDKFSALSAERKREAPSQTQSVASQVRDDEALREEARQRIAEQSKKIAERKTRSVMNETDAFAAKRPSRDDTKSRTPEPKTEVSEHGSRTLLELKDELRRLNKLEDDAYVEAARKANFSKEEVATVEGAIQAGDKEAWNLRDVLSDVKRKPKASENQTRAATQENIEQKKATTAQRKKAREMTDSYLASSIAKGQPDLETALKAARDYIEMQRARGLTGKNAWTMVREQNLIEKVGRYFDQAEESTKESFTPPRKGKGKDAPLDPKWVSEMQDALRAAAECAAASMGAAAAASSAAAAEAIIGTGLGAVAAAPIAIAGSSLYHSIPHPEHEGAVPFSSVRLDGDGFVDPASVIDAPRRTHGHAPVDQVPFDGYRNNPTTGHPLFAPPESAPQEPVDNSELGDRLINALSLPPRRRGPPE